MKLSNLCFKPFFIVLLTILSSTFVVGQYSQSETSIYINDNTSISEYDISNSGASTTFDGAILGTTASGSGTLLLAGGRMITDKDNATENVCEPNIYYTIYKDGERVGSPFFDFTEVKFLSESDISVPDGMGGNVTKRRQVWDSQDGNVDLSQFVPGDYKLEVYVLFSGDNAGTTGCEDLIELNNAPAQNYVASFTVTDPALDQVIVSPSPLVYNGGATITFDATGTDLETAMGDIYIHSGVSTDVNNPDAFSAVVGNWGQDDGVGRMTNTSGNIWEINIASLQTYYNLVNGEDIFGLNFLFRSADGTATHINGEQNYFVPVDPGNYFSILNPAQTSAIGEVGSNFDIAAFSSGNADWTLTETDINGNNPVVLDMQNALVSYSYMYNIPDINTHYFELEADFGGIIKTKKFNITGYSPTGDTPRPNGLELGINYDPTDPTKATLVLHAPIYTRFLDGNGNQTGTNPTEEKNVVHVIGDFNNWEIQEAYKMNRDRDGWNGTTDTDGDGEIGDYWWIELTGLEPGKPYVFQYLIDGETRIGDPYTRQVSDSEDNNIPNNVYPDLVSYPYGQTTGRASVIQTDKKEYVWDVTNFVRPDKEKLHIYELHFRDFTEEGSYLAAIEHLDHIKQLGFNAIHVMPVSEFEGNSSWGYNPNYYFAADKAYGTENDLKKFIDEAHKREIAVFNDVVLNHAFGSNPHALMYWDDVNNRPRTDNPWFNAEHRAVYSQAGHWGNDWNHESQWTQQFVDEVIDYWLQEFRFDGFRFDFTKGISQQPQDSNDEWASNYNQSRIDLLKRMTGGMTSRNPGAIVIFEHLANSAEDRELADNGILMWSGVGHHNDFKEFILGYNGRDVFNSGHHTGNGKNFANPHWISYAESHDEERLAYEVINFGNVVKDLPDPTQKLSETIERLKISSAFNLMIEGPRMMWEFQEFGYDFSINYNGRTGEKPVAWELGYDQDPNRQELSTLISQLLNARLTESFDSYNYDNLDSPTDSVRRMVISNNTTGREIIIIANIDAEKGNDLFPQYRGTGTYYRNNGDDFINNTFDVSDTQSNYFLEAGRVLVLSNFELPIPVIEDADGDGIYDADDTCPMEAGLDRLSGCSNKISIAVDKKTITEGEEITIMATMQEPLNEDVIITVNISGSAVEGDDYEALSEIIIPACFTSGTTMLRTIDDGVSETMENLTITAASATNAILDGTQTENINMNDNDCQNVKCPDTYPWNE